MPIDGVSKATDFELVELTLLGSSGTAVDLRAIFHELNLNEDLFGNTMSGALVVDDTEDLVNVLPIIGMEYLVITFIKPGTGFKTQRVFRVYKITDRKKLAASSEQYVLHFCSEEAILSSSIRISKSYTGLPISSIVKDICTTFLKIDSKKLPTSALTETQGIFDVVIPYWTPFYAINWLSRMARTSQSPGCSFLFFEDSDGYHFTSLESLVQQEPIQTINFGPMQIVNEQFDQSDTSLRHEAGMAHELQNSPDMLQLATSGAYAGKLTVIDPFSQKISVNTVNAATLFAQTKHLNEFPYLQMNTDRTQKPVTEHFDGFFRVANNKLKPETWLIQRNAYLSAMHTFQMRIEIPGSPYLRVGQVVILNLPAGAPPSDEGKSMDNIYSGRYLITSVRHRIDRAKYVCTLELSKDSVKVALPPGMVTNPSWQKLRAL